MSLVEGGHVSLSFLHASTPIRAGDLVVLSSGQYSDYGIYTMLKALKGFDPAEIARTINKDEDDWDGEERLLAYLLELELVVEVPYRELHVGNYGQLDPRVMTYGKAQKS